MKTIAEKIISDPKNSRNGEIQNHLITAAAEKVPNVEIKGTRYNPYYKFEDGSSMTIDHTAGDFDIRWPRPMV